MIHLIQRLSSLGFSMHRPGPAKEVSRVKVSLSLLVYNSSLGRVEAAARWASSADFLCHFHITRFNQGFIKSTAWNDPWPEDRVIVHIRDRCTTSCMFLWMVRWARWCLVHENLCFFRCGMPLPFHHQTSTPLDAQN
jgi:hypothetical protein